MPETDATASGEDCQKCGETVPDGKIGMHNRTVHSDGALFLHNTPGGEVNGR